ncbi:hypothetical protein Dimus_018383, partial [Dionaea muscipula]
MENNERDDGGGGDELPPSGLLVCPPSPMSASSLLCDAHRRSAGVADGGRGQGLGSLTMVEDTVDLERHSILELTDADSPLADEGVSVAERGCVGKPVCGTPELAAGCMERDDAMAGELHGVGDFARLVSSLTGMAFSSLSSVLSAGCFGVDGLVREEGWAPPGAKKALRLQPTNGLRQLPRPPEEPLPMSVVEVVAGGGLPSGGGGMVPLGRVGGDGGQSSRSYAHVVSPDRRADVELCYLPPADGGNSITMEEADGDAEWWGSCLVGYFLQGSLPFGYVRSSVTRLWMKSGLAE